MGLSAIIKTVHAMESKCVRRIQVAADYAATYNIFQVWTAPVIVKFIFGHVTTQISATATLPRIQFTPTLGGALTPLCVAALTISADPVGTLYTWDGAVLSVLSPTGVVGYAQVTETDWSGDYFVLVPGIISITNGGAAQTGGIIEWYIIYQPCAPEAYVTVAAPP